MGGERAGREGESRLLSSRGGAAREARRRRALCRHLRSPCTVHRSAPLSLLPPLATQRGARPGRARSRRVVRERAERVKLLV